MKRILVQGDGPLKIIATTDSDVSAFAARKFEGLDYLIVNESDIPDKVYRDSWELVGGEIKVNSELARAEALKTVRAAREALFSKLTIEAEQGADVSNSRQTLRDCTIPLIKIDLDEYMTVDEAVLNIKPLEEMPDV